MSLRAVYASRATDSIGSWIESCRKRRTVGSGARPPPPKSFDDVHPHLGRKAEHLPGDNAKTKNRDDSNDPVAQPTAGDRGNLGLGGDGIAHGASPGDSGPRKRALSGRSASSG